jgi:hypothetical protein
LTGGYNRQMETSSGVGSVLASLIQQGLTPAEATRFVAQMEGVSPANATAVAGRLVSADRATLVVVGDASKFLDKLKAVRPNVEVIPLAELDLDSPTLRAKSESVKAAIIASCEGRRLVAFAVKVFWMRVLLLPLLALALPGCVARTALDIVTLPVKVASSAVDAATVSQAEADQKRGRQIRKYEQCLGRADRVAERKNREPNYESCGEGPRRGSRDRG